MGNSGFLIFLCVIIFVVSMLVMVYGAYETAKKEERRRAAILTKQAEWGDALCQTLINKKIAPGMSKEMVALSWGNPRDIDKKEITKTGIDKERWVYGVPRKNANYIYFKNGEVDKINT
jgi:hypothetical protein